MAGFKEHGLMLYLSPELSIALVKLRAEKELGRSYAGLLALVEGMNHLGFLSSEDYEKLKRRYSQGLVKEQPLTLEQLQKKQKQEKMSKTLSMVLDQWSLHPDPKWRSYWIAIAEQWKDKVANAKLVLALANGESKRIE